MYVKKNLGDRYDFDEPITTSQASTRLLFMKAVIREIRGPKFVPILTYNLSLFDSHSSTKEFEVDNQSQSCLAFFFFLTSLYMVWVIMRTQTFLRS